MMEKYGCTSAFKSLEIKKKIKETMQKRYGVNSVSQISAVNQFNKGGNIMERMEVWNKLKQPPISALKKITGGRLAGKTDINPQWRYQVMTEVFGVCGRGWKYTIDKLWTEPAPAGEVFALDVG